MTDKPQPEAREFTMSQYASKDDMIGAMRKRIAELESELEAIGAGGMQALSAAPAGWKLVPEDATEEMVRATDKVNFANADTDGTMHNVWNVMLAATPTPPAEQQAATKAAPGEPSYSEKWDAELGRTAMRFVDRAGDVHPGIDDAETICAEFHKAMSEVIERMLHVRKMTPPKAAPTRTALPEGWTDCTIEFGNDGPEVVAYGPKRMMTRLAKWLGKYFAQVIAEAAPKAAPWEQNTVPAEWLEQAYREGWAACRDAETIGEEAEDWAFGNSTANSRMIDAQQAAPKQEAQEPVAWQGVHDQTDLYYTKPLQADVRPLYAAPQPAPECHHRPPCAECAARARLGEQT